MKKAFSIILVLMLLVSMAPVSAAADPETDSQPVLTIHAYSATFKESICPMFAVRSENADTVKLLIWRSEQEEYLLGSEATVLSSQGRQTVLGADCDVFVYAGFGAKEIADNVYARACTEKNGIAYYSEVVRYSLLDYAYYLTGKTGPASSDTALVALLDEMLKYGAAAQIYKNYHADRLATDTYYQIKVVNGTLSNGFPDELYKPGTSVTIMAQATDANGNAFNHWENKAGVSVGRIATMNVIVGNANEVYTAKYGVNTTERLEPSAGLEIEDGVVLNIGECTDDFVVLPDEHDGTVVTEINASAFAGEEFTSIFIPVSITTIGRRAFNNSSVTDVYYEGTEEQWGQISIGANNAALTGANIHFSSYGPTPVAGHTVTFKDYDGTVLSEQTVNVGLKGYVFYKWIGNYQNVTSNTVVTASYLPIGLYHTVTYFDYDGQALRVERVASGSKAIGPSETPEREGYIFVGWDQIYDVVEHDLSLTAQYISMDAPMFLVDWVSVDAGATEATIQIRLKNNPGICSAKLLIQYDEELTLTSYQINESELGGAYVGPEFIPANDSAVFLWYKYDGDMAEDIVFATLTFDLSANITGKHEIAVKYDQDDLFNFEEEKVFFGVINGGIIVE